MLSGQTNVPAISIVVLLRHGWLKHQLPVLWPKDDVSVEGLIPFQQVMLSVPEQEALQWKPGKGIAAGGWSSLHSYAGTPGVECK